MFLKLTQWQRPIAVSGQQTIIANKVKHTWINFNTVTEMELRSHKLQDGTEVTYTILFFNTSTHDDQASANVIETPEVICELLKENTTVKVLFGGN